MRALIEEGREYARIQKAYDNERFPDAGTPGYLISTVWLDNYKKYVFYDDLRYNATPSDYDDDHVTSQHPGKIVNTNLLHQEPEFLKGTGEIADFEAEVMDTYLHKDCMEPKDFEIINEQIWKFLS